MFGLVLGVEVGVVVVELAVVPVLIVPLVLVVLVTTVLAVLVGGINAVLLYTLRAFGPPQILVASPPQGIVQAVDPPMVLPFSRTVPHQHYARLAVPIVSGTAVGIEIIQESNAGISNLPQ